LKLANPFLFNNSTQTTLRQTLGARILQDCIENRDAIAFEIKEIIDEPASSWGVKVNN
jgi:regulator of protease activity HflC (stomatin/prohibitin superfamily)